MKYNVRATRREESKNSKWILLEESAVALCAISQASAHPKKSAGSVEYTVRISAV